MFDERAFIAKVESSDTDKLTEYLKRPTLEEEKALRAHLGDARYQRMHSMALRKSNASSYSRGVSPTPQKNVVVIHGIMGGELTTMNRSGSGEQVWVKAFRIMRGWLSRLRLNDDGSAEYDSDYDVHASGIMKRYYGELLLKLSINANVRAFWFDWRKDLQVAANDLDAKINGWFSDQPVHLVAHSMGGLVARTFIKKFPKRWETMKGEGQGPDGMELGGRLVMLGTPNYGSFSIPQVLTGIEGLVKKLTMLDFRHDSAQLLEVFNSFVGTYQMLPSPFKMKDMEKLYNAGIYPNSTVMQRHLDNAKRHHDFLRDVIDAERMIYIAGSDQPTFNDINDFNKLGSLDSYNVTRKGDGRVPHELGLLDGVQTYYVREEHGNLSSNADILDVLDELLSKGKEAATTLSKDPILGTRGLGDADNRKQLKVDFESDRRQMEIARTVSSRRTFVRVASSGPKSRTTSTRVEDGLSL
jgi:pimeloyl-ACP methyl ester carboxylesterase